MRATGVATVLAALALVLAGCSSSSGDPKATPQHRRTASGSASGSASTSRTTTVPPTKVLVVIEENHSYAQMRKGMPFLAGLSDKYGYATDWKAIAHPSEPNYLAIAGGSTFGVTDDAAPAAHYADVGPAKSVFDQALAAGKTAGTYAESMPKPCHVYDYPDRSVGTPVYAVRHNPWVYFQSGRQDCTRFDLPLSAFTEDAADNVLPNVAFLIPNLDHDAHNGTLAAADSWLDRQLSPVLASDDFTSGKLVVVVTADEDDKHSQNTVLTSVLTPALTGKVVGTPLTHYSLTRYIDEVLGVDPLREAAHAPDLKAAFGL